MKRAVFVCLLLFISLHLLGQGKLKSVLFDFEGMDINLSPIPDGAYTYGDFTCKVVANPLGYNDMLGERSVELSVNWNLNYGAFGKGNARYVEINPSIDKLNFYFYNPLTNLNDASIDLIFEEDDDDNKAYDSNVDDKWIKRIVISRSNAWQLISVPFSSFTDNNSGGNGILDAGFSGNGGRILKVEWKFVKPAGESSAKYFIDFICYSEGDLPTGNSVMDLPEKQPGNYCLLGTYSSKSRTLAEEVPAEFEGMFPASPDKKIKYVNTFLAFSDNGTVPNKFPGEGLQALINNGYVPIITWEPMFAHLSPSDPAQPKLQDIIDGNFDSYIDEMGDRLKSYSGTLIVRPMHEFDGDWYPWCISNNSAKPDLFITAFRHFVDRCRARGAVNVKWMWCPNSAPSPNAKYNWSINAYPGDDYVDYVATNIYNHPLAGTPAWKSFRYLAADCYYYLVKNFPDKEFIFCEMASRERYSSENPGSQAKPAWISQMDKDLPSFFPNARGLISFNVIKEHDWRINSSATSLDSYYQNIWLDDYYFNITEPSGINNQLEHDVKIYPNPVSALLKIEFKNSGNYEVKILNILGQEIEKKSLITQELQIDFKDYIPGIYLVQLGSEKSFRVYKIIVE